MGTRFLLTSEAKLRRWKPWILLVFFVVIMYLCLYTYYPENEHVKLLVPIDKHVVRPKKAALFDDSLMLPLFKSDSIKLPSRKKKSSYTETMPAVPKEREKYKPLCKTKKSHGRITFNTTEVNTTLFNSQIQPFPFLGIGGHHVPKDCRSMHRVGILVPYRDRMENLEIFLSHIHPFLMAQQLEYQIFVIEQYGTDLFNKGRLFNAGFKEVQKYGLFNCLVFHNVDLIPLNKEILYSCTPTPRHMCLAKEGLMKTNKTRHKLLHEDMEYFGTVASMTAEQFERINGFSNMYYGGGGEGNDMVFRLQAAGVPLIKYNKTIGVYGELPHKRSPINGNRFYLIARAIDRYKVDGLSNLEYKLISKESYPLFTHITVDINPNKENITALAEKWLHGHNTF